MIKFNVPPFIGDEITNIQKAIDSQKICGDGRFTKSCNIWMEERFNANKVLLTTSCTHALEMAAILADIKPGDEVIMPSIHLSQLQMHLYKEVPLLFLLTFVRIQ